MSSSPLSSAPSFWFIISEALVSSATILSGALLPVAHWGGVLFWAAWVNIIYGCNESCTYCVVPQTRGGEQSRTAEAIYAEVHALAAQVCSPLIRE